MATYRLSLSTVKRSAGRSVVAAVAYQHAARLAQSEGLTFYEGRDVHDYSKKKGVLDSYLLVPRNAPEWAHDRTALWNAAEAAERRKNSITGREIILSLPHELGLEDHQIMTRRFGEHLVRRYGVAVDIAVHAPSEKGDRRNVHAHLMMTTRELGPDGFGAKTRALDEGRPQLIVDQDKQAVLDADGKKQYRPGRGALEVRWMREEWAGIENKFLLDRGFETVDHRSLKEQGSERQPQPKLGPAAAALERRGLTTERGDAVRRWAQTEEARIAQVADPERGAANDSSPVKSAKPRHALSRIEREAEQFDAWKTQKLSQLSARHADDLDALGARQAAQRAEHAARMEQAYGGERLAKQMLRMQELRAQVESEGVRRLVGRASGASAQGRAELSAVRASVRDARQRQAVADATFGAEQSAERAQRQTEHQGQWTTLQERLADVRGLYGARRFDQVERQAIARRGNEAELARFDRENQGAAPAAPAPTPAQHDSGLSASFDAAARDTAQQRDEDRKQGDRDQDFDLGR
jgi:hypothetical protein